MSDYHFPFLRAVLILECRRTSFLPLGPDLQQDARAERNQLSASCIDFG